MPLEALATAQVDPWAYIVENSDYLVGGVLVTVALTAASILLGLAAGLPAAIVEVYGEGRLRWTVRRLGVVLRGTPIVVLIAYTFYVVPQLFGVTLNAFLAAMVALGLRSAAYQSQIFRGTIQAVSGGQLEAARAVGLTKVQAIRHVVLPQALRRSIPGFQNEFTIVLKDTSVAFAIGLAELLTRGRKLYLSPEGSNAVLEIFLAVSLVYFVLTFVTNRSLDYLGDVFAVPGGGAR